LTIELISPPATTTKPDIPLERYISISSYSDFVLDLKVRSLIGSRTKLEDIPKLTDLIQTKLRNVYIDKLVYPTFVKIKVPNIWKDKLDEEHDNDDGTQVEKKKQQEETAIEDVATLKQSAVDEIEEFIEDIKEA
jgi:maintenance of morphology protein 1